MANAIIFNSTTVIMRKIITLFLIALVFLGGCSTQSTSSEVIPTPVANPKLVPELTPAPITNPETVSVPALMPSPTESKFDQSLTDILPSQPESRGDIPQFVELTRKARESKNVEICNSLPTPKPQQFFFGDYYMSAPSLNQWRIFCTALVNEDSTLCQSIDRSSHPNLQQECQLVLEKVLSQKNESYTFCYEQFGSLYTSSDEVRNCFLKYKLDNAPEFYRDLFACLQQSEEPAAQVGSKRGECLYTLANSSKKSKVCDLIEISYPAYKYSVPNCKAELFK